MLLLRKERHQIDMGHGLTIHGTLVDEGGRKKWTNLRFSTNSLFILLSSSFSCQAASVWAKRAHTREAPTALWRFTTLGVVHFIFSSFSKPAPHYGARCLNTRETVSTFDMQAAQLFWMNVDGVNVYGEHEWHEWRLPRMDTQKNVNVKSTRNRIKGYTQSQDCVYLQRARRASGRSKCIKWQHTTGL